MNVRLAIQDIINKANNAVDAINEMNAAASNAQYVVSTISGTGGSGSASSGSGTSNSSSQSSTKETPKKEIPRTGQPSESDVKALQNVLNSLFSAGLTVDGKYGNATKSAVMRAQRTMYNYGIESMKSQDGLYGYSTRAAMVSYINSKINALREQGGSSAIGQGIKRYNTIKNMLPKAFYAKGTIGVEQDQWAITDEPQYGDELVLIPSKNGNLSYMRKGTSVVPANLTKKLIEIAQSQTGEIGNNLIKVSIPNVAVNNNIELSFDTLLRVENATQEAIPELKKLVQEQLDIFSRKLNYGIKRVGGVK